VIISTNQIKSILPHRSPFLFVHEVIVDNRAKTGRTELILKDKEEYWYDKSITVNDQDFLLLEAAAQVFGVTLSILLDMPVTDRVKPLLLGFETCEFFKSVDIQKSARVQVALLDTFGTRFRGEFRVTQNRRIVVSGELAVVQELPQ